MHQFLTWREIEKLSNSELKDYARSVGVSTHQERDNILETLQDENKYNFTGNYARYEEKSNLKPVTVTKEKVGNRRVAKKRNNLNGIWEIKNQDKIFEIKNGNVSWDNGMGKAEIFYDKKNGEVQLNIKKRLYEGILNSNYEIQWKNGVLWSKIMNNNQKEDHQSSSGGGSVENSTNTIEIKQKEERIVKRKKNVRSRKKEREAEMKSRGDDVVEVDEETHKLLEILNKRKDLENENSSSKPSRRRHVRTRSAGIESTEEMFVHKRRVQSSRIDQDMNNLKLEDNSLNNARHVKQQNISVSSPTSNRISRRRKARHVRSCSECISSSTSNSNPANHHRHSSSSGSTSSERKESSSLSSGSRRTRKHARSRSAFIGQNNVKQNEAGYGGAEVPLEEYTTQGGEETQYITRSRSAFDINDPTKSSGESSTASGRHRRNRSLRSRSGTLDVQKNNEQKPLKKCLSSRRRRKRNNRMTDGQSNEENDESDENVEMLSNGRNRSSHIPTTDPNEVYRHMKEVDDEKDFELNEEEEETNQTEAPRLRSRSALILEEPDHLPKEIDPKKQPYLILDSQSPTDELLDHFGDEFSNSQSVSLVDMYVDDDPSDNSFGRHGVETPKLVHSTETKVIKNGDNFDFAIPENVRVRSRSAHVVTSPKDLFKNVFPDDENESSDFLSSSYPPSSSSSANLPHMNYSQSSFDDHSNLTTPSPPRSSHLKKIATPAKQKSKASSAKAQQKRRKLINELLQSETAFQTQIREILEYKKNLEPHLSEKDKGILFCASDVEFIQAISQHFLTQLEEFWDTFNNKTSLLSPILKTLGKSLKCYANYAANYPRASRKLKSLEAKHAKFEKLFSAAGTNDSLILSNLLIVIVQRPSRLLMLITDIVKQTPEKHKDFEQLIKQTELYKTQNKKINEIIGNAENRFEVVRIEKKIGVELLSANRYYVFEGVCQKIGIERTHEIFIYLFNDLLVYGRIGVTGGFSLKQKLPLADACFSVVSLPDFNDFHNLIRVNTSKKTFLISCMTIEEKKIWLEKFNGVRNSYIETIRSRNIDYIPDDPAPLCMPKSFTNYCLICSKPFGFTVHKHHCDHCGVIVCYSCLDETSSNEQMCLRCVAEKTADNSIQNEEIKIRPTDISEDVTWHFEVSEDDHILKNFEKKFIVTLKPHKTSVNKLLQKHCKAYNIQNLVPSDYGLEIKDDLEEKTLLTCFSGDDVFTKFSKNLNLMSKFKDRELKFTIYNRTVLQWHRSILTNSDEMDIRQSSKNKRTTFRSHRTVHDRGLQTQLDEAALRKQNLVEVQFDKDSNLHDA